MSVPVRVNVRGADNVGRMIDRFGEKAKTGYRKGLRTWGEKTMTRAKREVPVRDGPLRSSGWVEGEFRLGRYVIIRLSFGGPARGNYAGAWVGYAIIQHERMDFQHTVGKAKYLEDPVRYMADKAPRIFAQAIKREVKGL